MDKSINIPIIFGDYKSKLYKGGWADLFMVHYIAEGKDGHILICNGTFTNNFALQPKDYYDTQIKQRYMTGGKPEIRLCMNCNKKVKGLMKRVEA